MLKSKKLSFFEALLWGLRVNILGVCLLLLPLLTIIWVFSLIRSLSKQLLQANKAVQH